MPLRPFILLINGLLVTSVFALGADYYINNGAGFGYVLPDYFYWFVIIGVLGMSVMWTLVHMLGGCLFGMAAGGVWDGLKLGFVLGAGLGVSRLWPYTMAWTAGIFAGDAPLMHILLWGMATGLLFGLNRFVMYFWGHLHNE